MTIKRKPAIRGKVIHDCNQTDKLDRHGEILERTSYILYGNGTPEDGLVFRFNEFMKDHTRVVNDISEIKSKVTEAIESSGKTANALAIYKAEMNGVEAGEGKRTAKYKLKFDTVISVIGTIAVIVGLAISTFFSLKAINSNETKTETVIKKVEDLGTPVTVSRGQIVPLPEGDSIKFYTKKGFKNFKDTAK